MLEAKLPTHDEVLDFGSAHNPLVWRKHREFLTDPSKLDAVLTACRATPGKLSRRQVFALADASREEGVIAAIVWGFPRGSMPGGKWLGFAEAFGKPDAFGEALRGLKANPSAATPAIVGLNSLVPGLGFATTTKMAYFARVTFQEGPALVFDANVIKAIADPGGAWARLFPKTRALLGPRPTHAHGVLSYGSFIEEASALAARHDTAADVIEVALFRSAARPGTWS
ncbi:hypothetical protein ACE10W_04785 [Bradyrhizobium sp. B025]|uniref:8-oxoguanine DNA glycosylase OGG fold protein n=1 Tax=Bradyrhizobium sp. B025 TaxID=3344829 RepID=UPI0035D48D36